MSEPQPNPKTPAPVRRALDLLSRYSSDSMLSRLSSLRQTPASAREPFSLSSTASELKDRQGPARATSGVWVTPAGQRGSPSTSHYQLHRQPKAGRKVEGVEAADLRARLESIDIGEQRRIRFTHAGHYVHVQRAPSPAHLQEVQQLFASGQHPVLSEVFVAPRGSLTEPGPAPHRLAPSRYLVPSAGAMAPHRAYLISSVEHAHVHDEEEEHLTATVRAIDWASFSEHDRLAILHSLMGKYARAHAAGFSIQAALPDIVLLKGREPKLLSAAHLQRLRAGIDFGTSAHLQLLCALHQAGLATPSQVKALLVSYLQAHPGALEHARAFLLSRSQSPKLPKHLRYQPGVPLSEQLYAWVEHYQGLFFQPKQA